jgi:GWxTD domain-containing protein
MHLFIDLATRSALLMLAVGVVVRALQIRTAGRRHNVWTAALVGMLTLPLWVAWGPRVEIAVPPQLSIQTAQAPLASPAAPDVARALAASGTSEGGLATEPRSGSRAVRWDDLVLAVYAFGACILLGRLALGTLRVRSLLRQAIVDRGYLTSAACATPITVGWIRPVIVLPHGYAEWPPSQLEAVLAHEREHVRRRDPFVRWLALLNRALFWVNPLAWWLERHLAALAEEACDDAVLASGYSRDDYAGYLVATARAVAQRGGRIQLVGHAFPGTSLPSRVHRILNDAPCVPESRMRAALALALCVASSAFIAAGTAMPALQGAVLQDFWLEEDEWHREVAPIMTIAESSAYPRLRTASERDAFIEDFWRRRDHTPATPENEARREFERRIAHAREHFQTPGSFAIPGYETDRGRFYVAWGPPQTISTSSPTEEWRYGSVPAIGSAVTLQFDPSADFGCSVRGGRYRILAPAPRARFDGRTAGGGAAPTATTYAGGFVHLVLPIHVDAAGLRFRMRARSGAEPAIDEIRGPIDYIQGAVLETRRGDVPQPILALVAGSGSVRFFERNSFACTEQLPPDRYTVSVETTLVNGMRRTDEVTFEIQ